MWGSASGHKIESETEPDIDFGSFLMSSITTGHESESEIEHDTDFKSFFMS